MHSSVVATPFSPRTTATRFVVLLRVSSESTEVFLVACDVLTSCCYCQLGTPMGMSAGTGSPTGIATIGQIDLSQTKSS